MHRTVIIINDFEIIDRPGYRLGNVILKFISCTRRKAVNPNAASQRIQPPKPNVEASTSSAKEPNVRLPKRMLSSSFSSSEMKRRVMEITPVESIISPYKSVKIQVKLVVLSSIRECNSKAYKGEMFILRVEDSTGSIRIIGYQEAVDKHYKNLHKNAIYVMYGLKIFLSDKTKTSIKHKYELKITEDTVIEPVSGMPMTSTTSTTSHAFDFITFDKLLTDETNVAEVFDVFDVIGIVIEIGKLGTTKSGLKFADLKLIDRSEFELSTTVWGKDATMINKLKYDYGIGFPLAIFDGQIRKYRGVLNLSVGTSAIPEFDCDDLMQAIELRKWYIDTHNKQN